MGQRYRGRKESARWTSLDHGKWRESWEVRLCTAYRPLGKVWGLPVVMGATVFFWVKSNSDIIKNKYLVFVPGSWHTVSKCLLYANKMTGGWGLPDTSRMGLVTRKTKRLDLEGWNFGPIYQPPGRWVLAGCRLSSIKTLKHWDSVSFGFGEHMKVLGGGSPREGMESRSHFPHTWPVHRFHLALPEWYPL